MNDDGTIVVEVRLPLDAAQALDEVAVGAEMPLEAVAAAFVLAGIRYAESAGEVPQDPPEAPDEGTVAALALAFLRADMVGAEAILRDTNLPMLCACAMAWWNGVAVAEYGDEGWERRLQAFLIESASRRSSEGGD
jgi:hypothetical protein